jgi:hypothetical protein
MPGHPESDTKGEDEVGDDDEKVEEVQGGAGAGDDER